MPMDTCVIIITKEVVVSLGQKEGGAGRVEEKSKWSRCSVAHECDFQENV